jgi:histidine ammonia-lyase
MKTTPITIHPNRDIDLGLVADFLNQPFHLELSKEAKDEISKSVDWMMDFIEKSDRPIYGINTGFGSLCETTIEGKDLNQLQANLVMSHAVGTGEKLSPEISRLMLWFKAHSLL